MLTRLLLAAGLAVPLAGVADDAEVPPDSLPALGVAADRTSVVGVSSGGYMATQLAVAWPERFHGLGVLAAGPWGCARGKLSRALNQCMMTRRGEPSLAALETRRADYQSRGQVGKDANLGRLRAFVWHGEQDGVIDPVLGDLLGEQLAAWLDDEQQLKMARDETAGHGWPVAADSADQASALAPCRNEGEEANLLACGEDVAGAMMDWLYPERAARSEFSAGELRQFDQSDFDARGLADSGYVYVPDACTGGGCGATLALHGCRMGAEALGDAFARKSGLNAWADAHDEVVLYPQAESTLANPQGCWDWWGFAESSWQLHPLHDTRDGTQAGALLEMLDRLQGTSDAGQP
ncbi:PHB depolymerase family esterase [Halomonas piscis]|uniref:PHB depolymerase family esterase n=1 Tax=Halomonas piscis TaxID=3031727 RepID=A0ABY9Z086_9GAMM|nr:PHB depolymerase family esterase [Halomonas piscis]WNK20437.1 PHB depolymerase family esterase [Halomonas piscis]